MNSNIIINPRFFKYLDLDDLEHSLEVIKILKYQNTEILKYEVMKGPNTGNKGKISIKDLIDEYAMLEYDGIISICIAKLQALDDVMVILMRKKDLEAGISMPWAICRQCISDIFSYAYCKTGLDYFGLSISQNSCPANVDFSNFLGCNKIESNVSIAYYIGETLDDILSMVKTDIYDDALGVLFRDRCLVRAENIRFIYDNNLKKERIDGYCKTLKELLRINNFEYDLLTSYNIIPINIDLSESNGDGGCLDSISTRILSELLCKNIKATIVLKYDKDIDLDNLEHEYQLVSDSNNVVYVIAYTYSGTYHIPVESVESDENIALLNNAVPGSKSIQDAYSNIRIFKDKY